MNCTVCGSNNPKWQYTEPVDDNLASTWGISKAVRGIFNYREGTLCSTCGVNLRAVGLAKGIMKYYHQSDNFTNWIKWANYQKLKVAEINSCHQLHQQLSKLKHLTFSDYGEGNAQDIQKLSYADGTFDLLLHSETLEHVPDPIKALDECRRVINDEGAVIFTIPMIWNSKTRQRATIAKGKVKNFLPPSYHGYTKPDYLVYWEFGRDFVSQAGCKVLWFDAKAQNYVLLARKHKDHISAHEVVKYQVLEKYFVLKQKIRNNNDQQN